MRKKMKQKSFSVVGKNYVGYIGLVGGTLTLKWLQGMPGNKLKNDQELLRLQF
jgi:hypothetical protein